MADHGAAGAHVQPGTPLSSRETSTGSATPNSAAAMLASGAAGAMASATTATRPGGRGDEAEAERKGGGKAHRRLPDRTGRSCADDRSAALTKVKEAESLGGLDRCSVTRGTENTR